MARTRAIAVDQCRGRVFVVTAGDADPMCSCIPTGRGAVIVLDARTGSVIRAMPVGVAPVAIVVDEHMGRAFVLNAGGTMSVRTADSWSWLPGWLRSRLPFLPAAPARDREQIAPASITVLDTMR